MFENLTDKLERSFKLIKGEGRITEINVAETPAPWSARLARRGSEPRARGAWARSVGPGSQGLRPSSEGRAGGR